MGSSCFWCKVGLAVVIAALLGLAVGTAVAANGAALTAWLVSQGLLTKVAAGAGMAAAKAAQITTVVVVVNTIILIVGSGLGVLFLGDYVCCKLLFVGECCLKGEIEFFDKLQEKLERPPPEGGEAGVLSSDDCAELRALIRRLRSARKIDAEGETTLSNALAKHCPGQ